MSSSSVSLQLDPLLDDLTEKKQSFRNNVVLLASDLKDTRKRLVSKEESLVREAMNRKIAEEKARSMEQEVEILKRCLGEKDDQLQASTSFAKEHLKELDELRSQLFITQASAEASAASAQSAQEQYLSLLKELDEKNISLKEHEIRVNNLAEQLNILQNDLDARELSQKQLKDEVMMMEEDIMQAIAQAGVSKDSELRRILDEISPRNIENINKHLKSKDDEIARLRDEVRVLSAHWKLKTKEFESQLEKHRQADQELKKRIVKLEFCLQEARAQTRKLQRMGERRDNAIKELKEQLSMKQLSASAEKPNFWENMGFKVVVSISMLVLVAFSRR